MNWFVRSRSVVVVGAAALTVLGVAGCSSSSSVSKDDVASTIVGLLQKQGVVVDNNAVTCPGDLQAEVGQTERCSFTTHAQPVDVVAKVSSVDGSTVNFDIATEARPVAKAVLEPEVAKLVGDQIGATVDKTDCAGDLAPTVGQSVTCNLTVGVDTEPFAVTVTKVDGGLVSFSVDKA